MRNPMYGMFAPRALGNVPGDVPIAAGQPPMPGRVQAGMPAMPQMQAPGNAQADLQRLMSQNMGNAALRNSGALQRQAAPAMAAMNLARQGVQDAQNLGAAQFGAGRYREGLSRDLAQQGVGLRGAQLGLQDAQLGFGDRQLQSQLMRQNANLVGNRLGQASGMLPFLLQYYGIGG